MNAWSHNQLRFLADRWWDWMLPMTWHVAGLVFLLTGLTWLLRRRSARLRYALWMLVPLRLALPPSLAFATGWAYSTVKTMLDRLVEKGYVKTRRVGNVYEYFPKIARPTAVNRLLDDISERLLGGSVAPFLQRLIEQERLTPEEAHELRAMLENYVEKKGGES